MLTNCERKQLGRTVQIGDWHSTCCETVLEQITNERELEIVKTQLSMGWVYLFKNKEDALKLNALPPCSLKAYSHHYI